MNSRDDATRRGTACVAPATNRRRSLRLPRFDYTQQGAYFVTIGPRNRSCLFGEIVNGEMRLSHIGRVAYRVWKEIPTHFPQVEIDALVVMPNHIHGVLVIAGPPVGATHASPLPGLHNLKRYPAYKDSGVPWLGEVPAHWEVRRLTNCIASLESGAREQSEDGAAGGIPSLGGEHVGFEGQILKKNMRYVS